MGYILFTCANIFPGVHNAQNTVRTFEKRKSNSEAEKYGIQKAQLISNFKSPRFRVEPNLLRNRDLPETH